jgi:hypothetical protein
MRHPAGMLTGGLALAAMIVGSTATAGETPLQCTVTFHLDQEVSLGSLQFHADYSKASGTFGGAGAAVDCTELISVTKAERNDIDAEKVLHSARIKQSSFTGPADVMSCRFEATIPPSANDFSVVVDDASPVETDAEDTGVCGAPSSGGTPPLARDALVALRTALGIPTGCQLCECDVDDSGEVTTSDVLKILKKSVHLSVSLTCPVCPPASTTTLPEPTTTTFLEPTTTTLLETTTTTFAEVTTTTIMESPTTTLPYFPSTVIDNEPLVTISVTVECPVCGNGNQESGEDCDDGNEDDTDGCLSDCTLNPCLSCDGEVCSPNDKNPCDDGVFCNGQDFCDGGTCSEHSGDPCSEGGECGGSCNEKDGDCTLDLPDGNACTDDENPCTDDVCDGKGACGVFNSAPCDDGLFCNGEDVCSEGECSHAGDPCPQNECSACEEETDNCFLPAGTECDSDEDRCTDDLCDGAGACEHPPIPLAPVCNWAVVAGTDTRLGRARTRVYAEVGGSICADTGDVGEVAQLLGPASWALLEDSGTAMTVRPSAVVTDGRVVTGGGCLLGKRNAFLFGTDRKGPICCIDGDVELPGGNPLNVINACGTDPLLADCAAAKAQVPDDVDLLDGLTATQTLAAISTSPAGSFTLTVGAGLNVVDVGRFRLNRNSTFVIDAQGNPGAVVILRTSNGFRASRGVTMTLAGGLVPENLLFYAEDGSCLFSRGVVGVGTLFCPSGTVRLRQDVQWSGAIAGGSIADIGWDAGLVHVPFLGLAQP